jgi:hypothetical protein
VCLPLDIDMVLQVERHELLHSKIARHSALSPMERAALYVAEYRPLN